MDNLKNVRISMFDRTNNSSQPVNVVTSANAVIVDGEEKNIKEYVDGSNLINTHISPKVDFGKYTTESDLFGENINDVVSEFIQHYTGGSPSNQPPVGPAPTLPMPGSTPAVSTTVPVEFTKRVEALETKLAAIESNENSTSSATTTPVSGLMFDCIEDIFPIQLDLSKFKSGLNAEYETNNNFVKSDIINIPELYYSSNDFRNDVNEKHKPLLCIKFKKGCEESEISSALDNLKINVYSKAGIKLTTYPNYNNLYQKYTYDKSKNLGTIVDNTSTYSGKIYYKVEDYIFPEYMIVSLTNQFIDESTSDLKYNNTFYYTSGQEYPDISDDKNLIIEMTGKSNVYKKSIYTCVVPFIITEFTNNNNAYDLIIEEYEKGTRSKNGEFLNNFFDDYGAVKNWTIPESTKFDCTNLSLPEPQCGIHNVYTERTKDNRYRIHYLESYDNQYYNRRGAQKCMIALSNTIKMYDPYGPNPPARTFKTFVNRDIQIEPFDYSIAASLSSGFQVTQKPILTRNGIYYIYGPNIINYDSIDSLEFTIEIPMGGDFGMVGSLLNQVPITIFKQKAVSEMDHL